MHTYNRGCRCTYNPLTLRQRLETELEQAKRRVTSLEASLEAHDKKEAIKASALAKLSDEEKKVLGF